MIFSTLSFLSLIYNKCYNVTTNVSKITNILILKSNNNIKINKFIINHDLTSV